MSRQYTTIQGDTFDIVALKMYGNEKYMHVLIDANYAYNNVVVFSAGVTLDVPDVTIPLYDNLPPWKR